MRPRTVIPTKPQETKKPLEEKTDSGGDSSLTVRSMEMPAERSPGRIVGEGPDAVDELIRLLREEAKAI